MKITLTIFLLYSSSLFAVNGNEVGNGGDVVICEGAAPILLDYYEGGKLYKYQINDMPKLVWKKQIQHILKKLKVKSEKLNKQYNLMYKGIERRLVFLDNAKLRDVKDSYEIHLPKNCEIKQIAIQRKDIDGIVKIHIDKDLWGKLSETHKAGLILHEIIYEHFLSLGEKNSIKARRLNSYLASKQIDGDTQKKFKDFLKKFRIPFY